MGPGLRPAMTPSCSDVSGIRSSAPRRPPWTGFRGSGTLSCPRYSRRMPHAITPTRRGPRLQAARARPLRRLGRRQHRGSAQRLRLCGCGRRVGSGGFYRARRARSAQPEKGVRVPRAAGGALPQGARRRRSSPLCQFRAAGRRQGPQRPRGIVHLRHQQAGSAARSRLSRHAGQRAAPLRRRQQARPGVSAQ